MTLILRDPVGPEVVLTRDAWTQPWQACTGGGAPRPASADELEAIAQKFDDAVQLNRPLRVVLAPFGQGELAIHARHAPAAILEDGARLWMQDGKGHREADLPAVEGPSGHLVFLLRGLLHRKTGPAIHISDNEIQWWRHGSDWTRAMNEMLADLAVGGRLLVRGNDRPDERLPCQIVTLEGQPVRAVTLAYAGWYDWILANRDQHYPQLAAAMRARAMREAMTPAPERSVLRRRLLV